MNNITNRDCIQLLDLELKRLRTLGTIAKRFPDWEHSVRDSKPLITALRDFTTAMEENGNDADAVHNQLHFNTRPIVNVAHFKHCLESGLSDTCICYATDVPGQQEGSIV